MPQIFVSYAHADHALLEKFLAALLPMADRIGLTVWWDQELQAGQKWDARIRAAIDESDVFLCFVTNAFLRPGGYIMKTELVKIREAEKSRHALVLPVIAESSHWSDEFGEIQAVPKTKKKALKPIVKWSPRSEGFHEASVQLKKPMLDFLNALPAKPDPGPGPAMAPTPTGFTLVGRRPSETEQADPALRGHHGDVLDALNELEPYLDRLGNVDPKLVSAIRAYAEIAKTNFADLSLDRLWSLGGRLCERVETVARGELAEIFDERTLRDVTGELNRLRNSHAVLIMGTEEGRALTARVATYRSAPRPIGETEAAALGVLTPMTRQAGLLEPATRGFVTQVTTPLAEGTERLDEIEAGLRTAVHAIAAFAAVLDPLLRDRPNQPADTAGLRRRFAGDPNLDTILAAFAYIEDNTAAVGTFARENPDLRRYVERTLEALGGIRRAPLRDPGEPPPGFDANEVAAMILRGEHVPREWIPHIKELHFGGESELADLSPLADFKQLRRLFVSGASVSNLAPLAGLTKLEELNLVQTSVSDLTPLAALTNLTSLLVWQTSVSDLTSISGLTNLTTLYVWWTSVSDLAPLTGLTNLMILNVTGTSVSDLAPLAGLRNLTSLDVSATSVSDLAPLAGLKNLVNLDVASTSVSDLAPLAGLKNLMSLDVSETSVSDLTPLAELATLKDLHISHTPIQGLEGLAAWANLASLDASGITGPVRWPLSWPATLTQLNLSGSWWPENRKLPNVPWRIDPDGTVHDVGGDRPYPFQYWVDTLERARNEQTDAVSFDPPDEAVP